MVNPNIYPKYILDLLVRNLANKLNPIIKVEDNLISNVG